MCVWFKFAKMYTSYRKLRGQSIRVSFSVITLHLVSDHVTLNKDNYIYLQRTMKNMLIVGQNKK